MPVPVYAFYQKGTAFIGFDSCCMLSAMLRTGLSSASITPMLSLTGSKVYSTSLYCLRQKRIKPSIDNPVMPKRIICVVRLPLRLFI